MPRRRLLWEDWQNLVCMQRSSSAGMLERIVAACVRLACIACVVTIMDRRIYSVNKSQLACMVELAFVEGRIEVRLENEGPSLFVLRPSLLHSASRAAERNGLTHPTYRKPSCASPVKRHVAVKAVDERINSHSSATSRAGLMPPRAQQPEQRPRTDKVQSRYSTVPVVSRS